MPTELSTEETEELKRKFKRCSEETMAAILSFRQTGDLSTLPIIVRGIVRRYLREETRAFFDQAGPETPLSSLGIDSLTMLEIMLDVQDALNIYIEDSDLKRLQTIGEVDEFLQQKMSGSPA